MASCSGARRRWPPEITSIFPRSAVVERAKGLRQRGCLSPLAISNSFADVADLRDTCCG